MSAFHPRRFDRAASTYGGLSGVQERMADALIALLPAGFPGDAPPGPGGGILEMGCGTGHLSRRLRNRLPSLPLLATDAAPRMLEAARAALAGDGGAAFARLDARGAPVGDPEGMPREVREAAPFALAASNALVQWFPDLEAHFSLAASLLAPGGIYLVAGFLRGNFPELNALLAEEPFGHRDFPGHIRAEVEAPAARAGLEVAAWSEAEDMERYPGAREFLDLIKGLGSSRRPVEGRPLTRGSLGLLIQRYQERYGDGKGTGVRATWRPWHALLRKA